MTVGPRVGAKGPGLPPSLHFAASSSAFLLNVLITSAADPQTLLTQVKAQGKLKMSFDWWGWGWGVEFRVSSCKPPHTGFICICLSLFQDLTGASPPLHPLLPLPCGSPCPQSFGLLPGCPGHGLLCSHGPHLRMGCRQFCSLPSELTHPESQLLSPWGGSVAALAVSCHMGLCTWVGSGGALGLSDASWLWQSCVEVQST